MERKLTVFLGSDSVTASDTETTIDNFAYNREKYSLIDEQPIPVSDLNDSGTDAFQINQKEGERASVDNNNFFKTNIRKYFSEWDWNLITQAQQKQAFIDAVAQELDFIAEKVATLNKQSDIDVMMEEFVPYLSYLVGYHIEDFSLNSFNIRELTKNMINFYSIKGTPLSFDKFFYSLGFKTSLEELWWENANEVIANSNLKSNYLKPYSELSQKSKDEILNRIRKKTVPYYNQTKQVVGVNEELVGNFNSLLVNVEYNFINKYVSQNSVVISIGGFLLIDNGAGLILDELGNSAGTIDYVNGKMTLYYFFMQSGTSGVDVPFNLYVSYTYLIPGKFYEVNKSNFIKLNLTNREKTKISNDPQKLRDYSEQIPFSENGIYKGNLKKTLISWQSIRFSLNNKEIYEINDKLLYLGTKVGEIDRINGYYYFEFDFYPSGFDDSGISSGEDLEIDIYYKYDDQSVLEDVSITQQEELLSYNQIKTSISYINFLTPVNINKESLLNLIVPIVENLSFSIFDLNYSIMRIGVFNNPLSLGSDWKSYATKTFLWDNPSDTDLRGRVFYGQLDEKNIIPSSVTIKIGNTLIQADRYGDFYINEVNYGFIRYEDGTYELHGVDDFFQSGDIQFYLKYDYQMLQNENLILFNDSNFNLIKGKSLSKEYYNTYSLRHDSKNSLPINRELEYKWRLIDSGYESGVDRYTEETQKETKYKIFSNEIWERGQIFQLEKPEYIKLNNKYKLFDGGFGTDSFDFVKMFKTDYFKNNKAIEEMSRKLTPVFFDSLWGYPKIDSKESGYDDLSYYWDYESGDWSMYDYGESGMWDWDLNFDFFGNLIVTLNKEQFFEQAYPFLLSMNFIPTKNPIRLDMFQTIFGETYKIETSKMPSGVDFQILRTYDESGIEYNDVYYPENSNESGGGFAFSLEGGFELHSNFYNLYSLEAPPAYGQLFSTMIDYVYNRKLAVSPGAGANESIEVIPWNIPLDLTYESGVENYFSVSDSLKLFYFLPDIETINIAVLGEPSLDGDTPTTQTIVWDNSFQNTEGGKLIPSLNVTDGNRFFGIKIINFDYLREYKTHKQGLGGTREDSFNYQNESGFFIPATRSDYYWDELISIETKNGFAYVDFVSLTDEIIVNKIFV
jgi:hypothetical protein